MVGSIQLLLLVDLQVMIVGGKPLSLLVNVCYTHIVGYYTENIICYTMITMSWLSSYIYAYEAPAVILPAQS